MSIDEGYIKFNLHWTKGSAPDMDLGELIFWRDRMHDLGLIGYDATHRVGFGNISFRLDKADHFVISATQTGQLKSTEREHYSEVTRCALDENSVWCRGPLAASSESMSHAALYSCSTSIQAIVHVHHKVLWEKAMKLFPTTSVEVPYGTPEMAREIQRLYTETDLPNQKLLAMAGHEDGLMTFGADLKEASEVLIQFLKRVR